VIGVFAALALIGALGLRIHRFGRHAIALRPASAIVVLGARTLPDGAPSPALQGRIEHAASLHRLGLAPLVLFSGGGSPVTEARVAVTAACLLGVPETCCVLEEQSRSTHENARFTAALLRARGVSDAIVVTDDFHLYRAVAHFRRFGVVAQPAPAPRALTPWARARWTLRELLAVIRRPWLLH
jgi:uncharacterized SAM-binding protein YcdF (DUF218 family)